MTKDVKGTPETDVPQLSLLDQLRMQHMQFVQQKDIAQTNLNQLIGAVYACELMIKKHEAEAATLQPAGEQGNVEADQQGTEQATQE